MSKENLKKMDKDISKLSLWYKILERNGVPVITNYRWATKSEEPKMRELGYKHISED